MIKTLEANAVYEVILFGGYRGVIRVQLDQEYLVLRAEPEKGDPREPAALDVIVRLAEDLHATKTTFRTYTRKATGPRRVDCIVIARKDVPVNFLPNLPSEVRDLIGIN